MRNAEGDFVIEDLPEMPELPWIVVDPLAPGKFYLFMLMLLKILLIIIIIIKLYYIIINYIIYEK